MKYVRFVFFLGLLLRGCNYTTSEVGHLLHQAAPAPSFEQEKLLLNQIKDPAIAAPAKCPLLEKLLRSESGLLFRATSQPDTDPRGSWLNSVSFVSGSADSWFSSFRFPWGQHNIGNAPIDPWTTQTANPPGVTLPLYGQVVSPVDSPNVKIHMISKSDQMTDTSQVAASTSFQE